MTIRLESYFHTSLESFFFQKEFSGSFLASFNIILTELSDFFLGLSSNFKGKFAVQIHRFIHFANMWQSQIESIHTSSGNFISIWIFIKVNVLKSNLTFTKYVALYAKMCVFRWLTETTISLVYILIILFSITWTL